MQILHRTHDYFVSELTRREAALIPRLACLALPERYTGRVGSLGSFTEAEDGMPVVFAYLLAA